MKFEKKSLTNKNQSVEITSVKNYKNFGVKNKSKTQDSMETISTSEQNSNQVELSNINNVSLDSQNELIRKFGKEKLKRAYIRERKSWKVLISIRLFLLIYCFTTWFFKFNAFLFFALLLVIILLSAWAITILFNSLSFNKDDLNNFELIKETIEISIKDFTKSESSLWNKMVYLPYRLKSKGYNRMVFEWKINGITKVLIKNVTISQLKSLKTAEDVKELMELKG